MPEEVKTYISKIQTKIGSETKTFYVKDDDAIHNSDTNLSTRFISPSEVDTKISTAKTEANTYTDTEIQKKIASVFRFKDIKENKDAIDLIPFNEVEVGDVYVSRNDNSEWVCIKKIEPDTLKWEQLGFTIDTAGSNHTHKVEIAPTNRVKVLSGVSGAVYSGARAASVQDGFVTAVIPEFTANTPTVIDVSQVSKGNFPTITGGDEKTPGKFPTISGGVAPVLTIGYEAGVENEAGTLTLDWNAGSDVSVAADGAFPAYNELSLTGGNFPAIQEGFYQAGSAAGFKAGTNCTVTLDQQKFDGGAIGQVSALVPAYQADVWQGANNTVESKVPTAEAK